MTSIHFVGGEKGGVGKSVVARLLAQYCIDHQLAWIGFDSDQSHGSLLRFYADFASPVRVDRYDSLDRIVEAAVAQPGQCVIVDLAAQTHQALLQWITDSGLLDAAPELDLTLTYWHVMDAGRDSVDLLRLVLDQFGQRLKIITVLNEIRGHAFDILAESGLQQRAQALGAQTVRLGRLQDTSMQKIDARSASFWAAVNDTASSNGLGLLERQRVKVWMRNAYQEFDRLSL